MIVNKMVAKSASGVLTLTLSEKVRSSTHQIMVDCMRRRGRCGLRFVARLLVAGMAAAPVFATAQDIPDAGRGRALYENHCQVCHTPRVHSRVNRLPVSKDELRGIVERWQREERLRWSERDVNDVVEFLNRTRYGYPPQ